MNNRIIRVLLEFILVFGISGWSIASVRAVEFSASKIREVMQETRSYRIKNEAEIVGDLARLIEMPNFANNSEDIGKNARWLVEYLESFGLSTRLLQVEGAKPAVYAEYNVPNAKRTITFYVHYDGQPVKAKNWKYGPYKPVLINGKLGVDAEEIPLNHLPEYIDPDWRLYGRSTSDDKAPIVGLMHALKAISQAGIIPTVNLHFFFEGEEEIGSPNLARILKRYKSLLKSDLWVFCDGPRAQDGKYRAVFGVRGVTSANITVYGSDRDLHSGHYGNIAPNPIAVLVGLLHSMRSPEGQVTIPGFYDNVIPPSSAEIEIVKKHGPSVEEMAFDLGIHSTENTKRAPAEAILWPALNFLGVNSGQVNNKTKNQIPAIARASIGIRAVPNQKIDKVKALVERHIASQGFHVVRDDPSPEMRLHYRQIAKVDWQQKGYEAVRTQIGALLAQEFLEIIGSFQNNNVEIVPTLGASLPFAPVKDVLGAEIVLFPIANHDNNQHAANENIRIGNLWDGIEAYAALFYGLGKKGE